MGSKHVNLPKATMTQKACRVDTQSVAKNRVQIPDAAVLWVNLGVINGLLDQLDVGCVQAQ